MTTPDGLHDPPSSVAKGEGPMGDALVLPALNLLVLLIQSAVIGWLVARFLRLDRDFLQLDRDARRSMAMLAEHTDLHHAEDLLGGEAPDEVAARRRRQFRTIHGSRGLLAVGGAIGIGTLAAGAAAITATTTPRTAERPAPEAASPAVTATPTVRATATATPPSGSATPKPEPPERGPRPAPEPEPGTGTAPEQAATQLAETSGETPADEQPRPAQPPLVDARLGTARVTIRAGRTRA